MNYGLSKSAIILLFKKNSFKNINLGDHFLVIFFLDAIFEPFYFLKLRLIFDELTFLVGISKKVFLFGQKWYFLGPTIFKIPQPNWYQIKDWKICVFSRFPSRNSSRNPFGNPQELPTGTNHWNKNIFWSK